MLACHVQQTLVAHCALCIAGNRKGLRLSAGGAAAGRRLGGELPVLPGQGEPCNLVAQTTADLVAALQFSTLVPQNCRASSLAVDPCLLHARTAHVWKA